MSAPHLYERSTPRRTLGLLLSTGFVLVACNAVLGIRDHERVPSTGGGSGEGGGLRPGSGGDSQIAKGGAAPEGGSDGSEVGGSPSGGISGTGGAPASGGANGSGGSQAGDGGAAEETCGTCLLPNAQSQCQNGQCVVTGCRVGFLDTNLVANDGCEAGDVPKDGLSLWLMADRGLTVSGTAVSAWADQSANHWVASQTAASAMPKLVQPSSGPPLLEFDGADDAFKLPEGFASFKGVSIFAIAQAGVVDPPRCAGILSLSNGDDADDIEFGRHTTNLLYYEVLDQGVQGGENAFEADKRLLVSAVQSSAGAVELRINGLLNVSNTIKLPANVVRKQNYVGKDTYNECPQSYKGQLGEVILFDRGVSSSEQTKIQAYLGTKWGVSVQ